MRIQDLIDMVKEDPALANYTLCLSRIIVIQPDKDQGEDPDDEMQAVMDCPILAISCSEEKEIRFIVKPSDISALETIGDRVLKLFPRKREDDSGQ